jgi:hypothetical protein
MTRTRFQPGGSNDLVLAVKRFETAERKLHEAMLGASSSGSSLRAIATLTGLSHERVRKIVEQERRRSEARAPVTAEPLTVRDAAQRQLRRQRQLLTGVVEMEDDSPGDG